MKSFFAILSMLILNVAFAGTKTESINISVTDIGFEPSRINVKSGTDIELNITRKTDSTCATEISIPSRKIKKELPLNKTISLNIGKLEKGEITFSCGMDMIGGVIFIK